MPGVGCSRPSLPSARPPGDRGAESSRGRCAGVTRRRWRGKATRSPVRVVLNVRPVDGAMFAVGSSTAAGAVSKGEDRLLGAAWRLARGEDCSVAPEIEATSAADGAFVLGSVPHGTATFAVRHADHAERELQVAVPGPLPDVGLGAGPPGEDGFLRTDGSPVERCEIGLTIVHPPATREAACFPTGFSLDHLPPGPARLRVSTRKGGDTQLGARVLELDVQIEANERWQQDFRWPAGDTIAGRVATADGAPVPQARSSSCRHGHAHNGSGYGVATQSDRDGRFSFRDLSPSGEWILTLSASVYRESSVTVTTGSGDIVVTAVAR